MAVELARVEGFSLAEVDPAVARLRAALDLGALVEAGYDPGREVFAPSSEHPLFGFAECAVADCHLVVAREGGVCGLCKRRWQRGDTRGMSREEFVALPRLLVERGRKREAALCRVCCVTGFERPAAGPLGLCRVCVRTFRRSMVPSVDEWIAGGQPRPGRRTPRPPATPRPTYGRCERCGRLAAMPDLAPARRAGSDGGRWGCPTGICGDRRIRGAKRRTTGACSSSHRCRSVCGLSSWSACRTRCTAS